MGAEADWAWDRDELAFAWRSAQDEALQSYRAWSESPGRTAYVVYRAAQDRADQAQDALAAHRVDDLGVRTGRSRPVAGSSRAMATQPGGSK